MNCPFSKIKFKHYQRSKKDGEIINYVDLIFENSVGKELMKIRTFTFRKSKISETNFLAAPYVKLPNGYFPIVLIPDSDFKKELETESLESLEKYLEKPFP